MFLASTYFPFCFCLCLIFLALLFCYSLLYFCFQLTLFRILESVFLRSFPSVLVVLLCVYKISQLFFFFKMVYYIKCTFCICVKHRFAHTRDIFRLTFPFGFDILIMLGGRMGCPLFDWLLPSLMRSPRAAEQVLGVCKL